MIKQAPLRYTITFHVEADNREALEAAVEHVMKYLADSIIGYVCGLYICACKAEIVWDGNGRLTVRSCLRRTARAVAKMLIEAYVRHGGKSIRLVRCEEFSP